MRRRFWAEIMVLLATAAFAVLAGCSPSTEPGVEPKYDRKSPDNLINFFAQAYEDQDIDAYTEALDFYFQFEFTPEVADSIGLPADEPWWGKGEDITSTENMFDDPEVTGVEMNLVPRGVGADWQPVVYKHIAPDGDDPDDEPDTTVIEGLGKEFDPDIKVHIDEPGKETLTLWVNDSILDVWVTQDRDYEDLWTIMRVTETLKSPGASPRSHAKQIKGRNR